MNNFKEALKQAIECEGITQIVNVTNIDGTNPRKSTMTFRKEGTAGEYKVEYHNRYCFYHKGNIVAQYFEGDKHISNGNDSKRLRKYYFNDIKEAVQDLFKIELSENILCR